MQIYEFPFNYRAGAITYRADDMWNQGVVAHEVVDGRADTFIMGGATERFIVNFEMLPAEDTPPNIDSVFCVTSGFDTISVQHPTNNEGVQNIPINTATQRRHTRHYANVPIGRNAVDGTTARVTFDGGPGRIFSFALTRHRITISEPNWTEISHRKIAEGAERRMNINGNSIVIPSRAGRWKWRTDFRGYFRPDANPSVEQVVASFENNDNMFVWPFPTDQPTFFYPAAIDPATVQIEYIGGLLTQRELAFVLQEL